MRFHPIPVCAAPSPGEVHVWRVLLTAQAESYAGLMETLSVDERQRARRYVRARDSERFVTTRGILRELLGWYLGEDPAALRFTYGDHGKPILAEPDHRWLRFNVSHSDELAIVGIATEAEIGVDVERIREEIDVNALAAHALDPAYASSLPREVAVRRRAFFAHWTQQEAYWKALGCGLSGLGGMRPSSSCGYSLVDLSIDSGYKASLAIAGPVSRVVQQDWIWKTRSSMQPASAEVGALSQVPRS